jgi:hypothetical protein
MRITQHISSTESMLAQVVDVKFHTLCDIFMSFPQIDEIWKEEIFAKLHATRINTCMNDSKCTPVTKNASVQVVNEKF